jgi:hypothetical protein
MIMLMATFGQAVFWGLANVHVGQTGLAKGRQWVAS